MGPEPIFKPIEKALWEVLDMLQEFAINYIFGVLALIFGIRFVSGLLSGRVGVISLVLTIILGFFAVTMGQTFWTKLPIYNQFF